MKGFIKFLIDFGPLAIFFIFYKRTGNIIDAIIPLIIATFISILISYIIEKKIPLMPSIGGIIILIFGGLTIYFDNKTFLYMKPTIINIIFAAVLFGGNYMNKPFLKYLMGSAISLEDKGWFELSKRWILFFIFLAITNEIIWRNFSMAYDNRITDDIWVNFKVFGNLILTFIFSASLFPIIKKYQKNN